MKERLVYTVTIAGFPISLYQHTRDCFTVTYGKEAKRRLSYVAAAHELGECIFHALATQGKLDNT